MTYKFSNNATIFRHPFAIKVMDYFLMGYGIYDDINGYPGFRTNNFFSIEAENPAPD